MADGPLTLHFQDWVHVAGEVLQGHVDVNIPSAMQDNMEKVLVKLRGSIVTKITETEHKAGEHGGPPENKTHYQVQTVQLLRLDQTVWDQYHTPQGGQTIACPFAIQLPPNLPPSFHSDHYHRTVVISYSLEVEGVRHGMFHMNRRIRKIISVVPPATPWELNANAALQQGWQGPWKPIAENKEIRHGIFGEHAQVKIELVLPDLPSFPMVTGIPFSFHVFSKTKAVHREDLEDKHGKLFPAPPTSPADVELVLYRRGRMRVHHKSESMEDKFELKGSLGDKAAVGRVRTVVDQPEFVHTPDQKEGKGSWKRAIHFDGMLSIPYAPSFTTETAEWHYCLRFKVEFPGIGNDLDLEFPVQINSGAACPPLPPNGYHTNVPYTYPGLSGPPPMMTLPSAYWSGENNNWDEAK